MSTAISLCYILSAVLFILGLKMMGNAATAVRGNGISALGMLLAVVVTLLDREIVTYQWIVAGVVVGGAIGLMFGWPGDCPAHRRGWTQVRDATDLDCMGENSRSGTCDPGRE